MKRSAGILLCLFLASSLHAATNAAAADSGTLPTVAILDIRSTELDADTSQTLSEILRTELFKLHIFKILERSMIQSILEEQKLDLSGYIEDFDLLRVGRLLSVEKLVVMTVGMMNKNIAVNIRVINVEKATLDYSENVFINTRESIIDAIKDLAKKIEVYYVLRQEKGEVGNKKELLRKKWMLLGANTNQAEALVTLQSEPDRYLEIRQYDISFKVEDYLKAIRNGWDPNIIKNFLKEGIPYQNVMKSLNLGISDLSVYYNTFKLAGLSYDDYLLAYENHIYNIADFRRFKEGYRTDRIIVGMGGAADSFPIANAPFKFLIAQIGWEHFWSENQRETFKYSMEMGLNMLNGLLPAPYFQANIYAGKPPFYGKFAVGGLAEVLLGGHFGLITKFGIEVLEMVQFEVVLVPTGTQPGKDYSANGTKAGQPGYIPINFPYFGALISWKF